MLRPPAVVVTIVQTDCQVQEQNSRSTIDNGSPEHYIMDGSLNVGVFTYYDATGSDSLKHWNIVADGVAGRIETNGKLYYLTDHLGSTRTVIDENGLVVESHDYYPFGLQMPGRDYLAASLRTKELFTGKELDDETGWHYFGARPYISSIGRFPTVDPLANLAPDKTPYHYTSNNPVNRIDPTGMADEDDEEKKKGLLQTVIDWLAARGRDFAAELGHNPGGLAPEHVDTDKAAKKALETAAGDGSDMVKVVTEIVDSSKKGTSPTPDPKREALKRLEGEKTGKSDKHSSVKRRLSNYDKYLEARKEYEKLRNVPNKSKAQKKELIRLRKRMLHFKSKADQTGETHHRKKK